MNNPKKLSWEMEKIIEVAYQLKVTGGTAASTSERIAAAFVLDRQDCLPEGYDLIEAWDRLGSQWQQHVRLIKRDYMHRIEAE